MNPKRKITQGGLDLSSPLSLIQLQQPNSFLFRRWVHLYAQRFPFYERAAPEVLQTDLTEHAAQVHGFIYRNRHLQYDWAGFTFCERHGAHTLLAYLATHPNFEGQGLARRLVAVAQANFLSAQAPYFWIEAEPHLWAFYNKLGFYQLPFLYYIPRFYHEGVVKMGLFVRSCQPTLSRGLVKSLVAELYDQSYGLSGQDPRFQMGLNEVASLPEQMVLPHWAIERGQDE